MDNSRKTFTTLPWWRNGAKNRPWGLTSSKSDTGTDVRVCNSRQSERRERYRGTTAAFAIKTESINPASGTFLHTPVSGHSSCWYPGTDRSDRYYPGQRGVYPV